MDDAAVFFDILVDLPPDHSGGSVGLADLLRQYAKKAFGFGTDLPFDRAALVRLIATRRQLKSDKLSGDL
jgi:hypothetical protein